MKQIPNGVSLFEFAEIGNKLTCTNCEAVLELERLDVVDIKLKRFTMCSECNHRIEDVRI